MDENFSDNTSPHGDRPDASPYPRWVVGMVFTLLFSIAVLSVWQLKSRLVISLPKLGDGSSVQEVTSTLLQAQDDQLKQQDSDQDGLSDYDEMKVYGTSPYIADTDSDGISDAAEVRNGTDPNCPTGKTCTNGSQVLVDSSTSTNPFLSEEFKAVLNDPKQLRQLLIQGGADPAVINGLDDQTIQILGQEAYQAATQPTQEKIDILKQVTPDQIRAYLKNQGVSDQQLSQFTDDQLNELYNQALQQAASQIPPAQTP